MTPAEVNAMPERVRRYIHDLESRCDPAGEVADRASLREQRDALAKALREVEAFRDLVRSMRVAQKGYFKSRDFGILEESKRLEREVDADLAREGQASLFPESSGG